VGQMLSVRSLIQKTPLARAGRGLVEQQVSDRALSSLGYSSKSSTMRRLTSLSHSTPIVAYMTLISML
jgi:hypothetical protein